MVRGYEALMSLDHAIMPNISGHVDVMHVTGKQFLRRC
jgi:hypothetical protein